MTHALVAGFDCVIVADSILLQDGCRRKPFANNNVLMSSFQAGIHRSNWDQWSLSG